MIPPVVPAWRTTPLPRGFESDASMRGERARAGAATLHAAVSRQRERRGRARHTDARPKLQGTLVAFLFDGFQLGFRGVAFLRHPVERVEEIVDLRVGGLRHLLAHDLDDFARALPLQELLRVFLA